MKKNQQGFSITTLAVGVTLAISVIIGGMWAKVESNKIEKAQLQGRILKEIAHGLDNYIIEYHNALYKDIELTKVENNVENIVQITDKYRPTLQDLQDLGLTQTNISANNLYGGGYVLRVDRVPQGCTIDPPTCRLEGVVALDTPISTTGLNIINDAEKLAGYAIKEIGPQGGFSTTDNPTNITYLNGGNISTSYLDVGGKITQVISNTSINPMGNQAGILAARTNYNTSSILSDELLPRDGSLEMTGNLRMGEYSLLENPDQFNTAGMNNSIKNTDRIEAREMEVSQDLTVGRDLTVKRHIIAGNKDDLTYATFDFYGTTNIGNKDGNVSDMPLLNVFGRSVFGKQGQIYSGNANPLMTVLGDVNFGAQGQAPVQFNVFGDTNISRYLFVGDGTGMSMSNQTRNSDAAKALIAGNGNDKVVLDVNGNAIIDQSLGVGKYIYTGNGIGVVSNITDASTGKGNNTNAIVDTANSVLDVNGNAVISKNLKVYGGAYINDYLYTGNGIGQAAKVRDNTTAVNAIGNNVVFEANGSANIGKNLAVGKYAYIGDGLGVGVSKIPNVNKLTNVVLDVNGDLAVAKDSQFLGNMTIGTGGMAPDGGNKGNLYITGNTDTYNVNVRNDLTVNRNTGIGNELVVNGHTQLNSLKVLGNPTNFMEDVNFDDKVVFQGKVKFIRAIPPKYGEATCNEHEMGFSPEGDRLICRNGKWDWAEPEGTSCGIGFFKDPFHNTGARYVNTVVPCKNASQVDAEFKCPNGYKTSLLHVSTIMTPHIEHPNSRSSAMNAAGATNAQWAEFTGGVYRMPLFAEDDMNPEAKGYLGASITGKARVTFQADYSNYKTGNVQIQTPSSYDTNNVIQSLGKKASPVDIYTNYDKDGNLIVEDVEPSAKQAKKVENLPKDIATRYKMNSGNKLETPGCKSGYSTWPSGYRCLIPGPGHKINNFTGKYSEQYYGYRSYKVKDCIAGHYVCGEYGCSPVCDAYREDIAYEDNQSQHNFLQDSNNQQTTFNKTRKLKQGLDFAVMPMYMANCVKEKNN